MYNDHILLSLRQSIRQFNPTAIEFHLERLLKKAGDASVSPRLKVEIYLEAVKAFRLLNRTNEAARYAEVAIANIPAESIEILSALKRIRALLYLDSEDYSAAHNLIEGTDGLELVLEGNRSLVTRTDEEVKVETWLVSMEIALAMRDLDAAEDYFNKAINRLSTEEAALRRKRINPKERKTFEQYYHDLSQMLSLCGLTLGLANGDSNSRAGLQQLCRQVADENNLAAAARKLPNVPLHSKLLCLLGGWSPDSEKPPAGLSMGEARRWAGFAASETGGFVRHAADDDRPIVAPSTALEPVPAGVAGNPALPQNNSPLPVSAPNAQAEKALDITASALERMAQVFQQFENILPNVQSYLKNGGASSDYSKRGFSGHLLDTDLYNFMQNFAALQFTGYLQLEWDKDLYKPLVLKGVLPEIVRCGEANIYVIEGVVTDAAFEGQSETGVLARAQENFVLLVRMCLSIGVDDMRPDILGRAVPEEAVAERPRLLNVGVNDLLFITSDIESELAGLNSDEQQSAIEVLSQPIKNENLSTDKSAAETRKGSFEDLDESDLFGVEQLPAVVPAKKPTGAAQSASSDSNSSRNSGGGGDLLEI